MLRRSGAPDADVFSELTRVHGCAGFFLIVCNLTFFEFERVERATERFASHSDALNLGRPFKACHLLRAEASRIATIEKQSTQDRIRCALSV